jgi:hypothetical protein
MWKFVDELYNYAKLISLERINSYNKQRHNTSSQSHDTIKCINWCNNAMYLINNDVYRSPGCSSATSATSIYRWIDHASGASLTTFCIKSHWVCALPVLPACEREGGSRARVSEWVSVGRVGTRGGFLQCMFGHVTPSPGEGYHAAASVCGRSAIEPGRLNQ